MEEREDPGRRKQGGFVLKGCPMHIHYCGSLSHDIPMGFLGFYISFPDLPWVALAMWRDLKERYL